MSGAQRAHIITGNRPRATQGERAGELLSLQDSASRARPLRCWAASDRARVAEAACGAFRRWLEAWGLSEEMECGAVRCDPAFDGAIEGLKTDPAAWRSADGAGPALWYALSSPAAPGPSQATDATLHSSLCRALFDDPMPCIGPVRPAGTASAADSRRSIAREVVNAAWSDWCKQLAGSFGVQGVTTCANVGLTPGREVFQRWSGGLCVTLPWWKQSLTLLMAGDRVAQFLGPERGRAVRKTDVPAVRLTPVGRALARRSTRVRAQLHPFELDLGALAGLRIGDVLRTTHTLDTALSVNVDGPEGCAGEALCSGFLGKLGSSRAVGLMAPGPASWQPGHRPRQGGSDDAP